MILTFYPVSMAIAAVEEAKQEMEKAREELTRIKNIRPGKVGGGKSKSEHEKNS